MKKALNVLFILFLFFRFFDVLCQASSLTTGNNIKNSEGSLSYSIGQVFYSDISDESLSMNQGLQQPFEFFIISNINDDNKINLRFSVYPNPSNDICILDIGDYNVENLHYQLFNLNGILLQKDKIVNNETIFDLAKLNSDTYLLIIYELENELKTFKIIKTY